MAVKKRDASGNPINASMMKPGKRRVAKAKKATAERSGAAALGTKMKARATQAASRPYSERRKITSVQEGMRVYAPPQYRFPEKKKGR
jgi:hypothetical protein